MKDKVLIVDIPTTSGICDQFEQLVLTVVDGANMTERLIAQKCFWEKFDPNCTLLVFPGNGAATVRQYLPDSWLNQWQWVQVHAKRYWSPGQNPEVIVDRIFPDQIKLGIKDIIVIDDVTSSGQTAKLLKRKNQPWVANANWHFAGWIAQRSASLKGYKTVFTVKEFGTSNTKVPINSLSTLISDNAIADSYIDRHFRDNCLNFETLLIISRLYKDVFWPQYITSSLNFDIDDIFNSEVMDYIEKSGDQSIVKLSELIGSQGLSPKSILIIGAGSGSLGNVIRKQFPQSRVVELDRNKKVVDRLKARGNHVIECDANDIKLSDNSQDITLLYGCSRYCNNKKNILTRIQRVTKTGGLIIIGDSGAKGKIEINEIISLLQEENITFKHQQYNNVYLPRLSFFYFLVDYLSDNNEGGMFLKDILARSGEGLVQQCYKFAGHYFGESNFVQFFVKKNY